MTRRERSPCLGFHQVLEDEYEALHGQRPPPPAAPEQLGPTTALASTYAAIDALAEPHAALCLSGGGIRSATFALGVIQGLARMNLLGGFHYISTVSGGGYIGSWLSSWIHWHHLGLEGVVDELRNKPSVGKPDPHPVQHLRRFSNYLTPRLGLFSADSWTAVATVLRNLVLNWTILLPFLAAIVVIPSLYLSLLDPGAGNGLHGGVRSGVSAAGWLLVFVAVLMLGWFQPSTQRRRQAPLPKIPILGVTFLPLVLGALLITASKGAVLASSSQESIRREAWLAAWIAAAAHLAAWYLYTEANRRGPLTSIAGMVKTRSRPDTNLSNILGYVVRTVAVFSTGALAGFTAVHALAWLAADPRWYAVLGPPAALSSFLVGATLFVGLMSRVSTDDDREYWARFGAWVLLGILVWSVLGSLVLFGPRWLEGIWTRIGMLSLGTVAGAVTWVLGRSPATPAIGRLSEDESWKSTLLRRTPEVSGFVFLLFLFVFLSWGIEEGRALAPPNFWSWRATAVLLAGFWLVMVGSSFFVNVNRFSLHALYRNRLTRAYLGASRERAPHPFTGFDPQDDVRMKDLKPGPQPAGHRPIQVINCTLNLVAGEEMAWQERKACSFTVSPLHCGSGEVGYRRTEQYGGPEGISLGTAMAISGAAVSPNMGYNSSPLVTFLLTLFNARLGCWLGNPGPAGEDTHDRDAPGWTLIPPIVKELFGWTDRTSPYVYLSDGGHFDNTGIYEMVRRRCRVIMVSDAGCDPRFTFDDLGNAVRKIRIDLGVPIELEKIHLRPKGSAGASAYCALGRIGYEQVAGGRPGLLIYLKPALAEKEPIDVRNYATTSKPFPHEPTSDQWFSETQFESYRMLGRHIVESICQTDLDDLDFDRLRQRITRYLAEVETVRSA